MAQLDALVHHHDDGHDQSDLKVQVLAPFIHGYKTLVINFPRSPLIKYIYYRPYKRRMANAVNEKIASSETTSADKHDASHDHDLEKDYRTIYVTNLDSNCTEYGLINIFGECGVIEEVIFDPTKIHIKEQNSVMTLTQAVVNVMNKYQATTNSGSKETIESGFAPSQIQYIHAQLEKLQQSTMVVCWLCHAIMVSPSFPSIFHDLVHPLNHDPSIDFISHHSIVLDDANPFGSNLLHRTAGQGYALIVFEQEESLIYAMNQLTFISAYGKSESLQSSSISLGFESWFKSWKSKYVVNAKALQKEADIAMAHYDYREKKKRQLEEQLATSKDSEGWTLVAPRGDQKRSKFTSGDRESNSSVMPSTMSQKSLLSMKLEHDKQALAPNFYKPQKQPHLKRMHDVRMKIKSAKRQQASKSRVFTPN